VWVHGRDILANIPRMMGVDEAEIVDGKISRSKGMASSSCRSASCGARRARDLAPIIMKIIQQFLRDVAWASSTTSSWTCPGTGDAQLARQ